MSEPEVLDAEVVPDETGTDLVVVETGSVTLFGTDDPDAVIEKATAHAKALVKVVQAQKLVTSIQGRDHVQVEGWTLLGSMVGVFPATEWTRAIESDGKVVGYEARVRVVTRDGAEVGAGESMCMCNEANWSGKPLYAVRAMSETRATSRALRRPLGFIVKLAGYDPCSAEEATDAGGGFGGEGGPTCPKCKGPLWDNRQKLLEPDCPHWIDTEWACRDRKGCGWTGNDPEDDGTLTRSGPAPARPDQLAEIEGLNSGLAEQQRVELNAWFKGTGWKMADLSEGAAVQVIGKLTEIVGAGDPGLLPSGAADPAPHESSEGAGPVLGEVTGSAPEPEGGPITARQRSALFAAGLPRDKELRLAFLTKTLGREITSTDDIRRSEFETVQAACDELKGAK